MIVRMMLAAVLLSAGFAHAAIVNSIAASVGRYAITAHDIRRMNDFLQINTGVKKSDLKAAFHELIYAYGLIDLADQNENIMISEIELNSYLESLTNQQSAGDARAFYRDYLDLIRINYKKNQVIRSILSFNNDLKFKIGEDIPEKKMRDFYNKNRASLIEPPSIDVAVIGVSQPATSSLDELERFEKSLDTLIVELRKTNDVQAVLNKAGGRFSVTPFSGRTGMKNVYELIRSGLPNEVLGIALASQPIRGPKGMVTMRKGTVYGPAPIVLQGSERATYLIVKLIDRKMESRMTFEAARPIIERKLREDRVNEIFRQFVTEQIASGEITVSLLDKNYEGAYNEFVRR